MSTQYIARVLFETDDNHAAKRAFTRMVNRLKEEPDILLMKAAVSPDSGYTLEAFDFTEDKKD